MIANIIAAAASIVTACVALLVFREARRIRELDWINRTNMIWNDFNKILLEDEVRETWLDFLTADDDKYSGFKLANKVNWIAFYHLNVLVTSIHLREYMRRTDVFFKAVLEAEFQLLWKRRRYIQQLMDSTGYDSKIKRYFARYCQQIDRLVSNGATLESAFDKVKAIDWLKPDARHRSVATALTSK